MTLLRRAESSTTGREEAIEPRLPSSLAADEVTGENLKEEERICVRAWNSDVLQKPASSSFPQEEKSRQRVENIAPEIKKTGLREEFQMCDIKGGVETPEQTA